MAAKPPQLDEAEATKILMAGLKVRYDDLSEAQIKRLEKLTAEYVANIAKILLNANGTGEAGPIRRFFDRPVLENSNYVTAGRVEPRLQTLTAFTRRRAGQTFQRNNLAHHSGIAAHPREHAVGLFPPWRRRGLDTVYLPWRLRIAALRAPAARAIGAAGAAFAQQAERVACAGFALAGAAHGALRRFGRHRVISPL